MLSMRARQDSSGTAQATSRDIRAIARPAGSGMDWDRAGRMHSCRFGPCKRSRGFVAAEVRALAKEGETDAAISMEWSAGRRNPRGVDSRQRTGLDGIRAAGGPGADHDVAGYRRWHR